MQSQAHPSDCSSSFLLLQGEAPLQPLLLRLLQAAVGCWQPPSVQSTMAEIINPVFPLKIKLNGTSGSFPSPTLYFDMPYL